MSDALPSLRFLAEPRGSYRARYMCEGRPSRNRSQRFVRADENTNKYVYPTIEIPTEWTSQLRQPAYIRVTHVTCPNEQVSIRCIHPYPIATEDTNVIQNRETNSLFFPISDEELESGRKSFQFTLYKLTQYQLRTYGSLQILNPDEQHDQHFEDPTDPRKIIDTYQLAQSQILCSIAIFQNNNQQFPVTYNVSSVYSQVMTAVSPQNNDDEISVRFTPQRGDVLGGDEILMVIPRIDRRKPFTVRFDHPSIDPRSTLNIEFVDTKTISFYTPPCPVFLTRENSSCTIPIVVIQNNNELVRIHFLYQSMDRCFNCHSNKRSYADLIENDDFQFNDAIVEPADNLDFNIMTTQIQQQFEMLENAIKEENLDLALQLIEQTMNILLQRNNHGETPLLMAAKMNQEKLIMFILNKQLNLITQTDQQGNNLLHLLANISENRAENTIKQIFSILDGRTKDRLISELNQFQQKPIDVAKDRGQKEYADLLNHPVNFFNIH